MGASVSTKLRIAILFLAMPSLAAATHADEVEKLRIVTYNVHGLPHLIARDEPARRMPLIARELQKYDLALVQEDFEYPELLESPLPSGTRVHRGPGRRLHWKQLAYLPLLPTLPICWALPHCSLPQGSGLTTFVRPGLQSRELPHEHYRSCSGFYLRATDCMGSKGFQAIAVEVVGGRVLHVYNTHVDAGRHFTDRAQRKAQFIQLAAAIRRQSAGRALVVVGDMNSQLCDREDQEVLRELLDGVRPPLVDSGAHEPKPNPHGWAGLDYILTSDGTDLQVVATDAGLAAGFEYACDPEQPGSVCPLSDHPAISATIELRPR